MLDSELKLRNDFCGKLYKILENICEFDKIKRKKTQQLKNMID